MCNEFEYLFSECNSSSDDIGASPLSGKFTGWFNMDSERIREKDVSIHFCKNSDGYYNVKGTGVNVFGPYKISGTMKLNGIVTFFRHYLPRSTF